MRPYLNALATTILVLAGLYLYLDNQQPVARKTHNVAELREKLAYLSLAERLAYESSHTERRITLPENAKEAWESLEVKYPKRVLTGSIGNPETRGEALRILHSDEVGEFIKREGFGENRMTIGPPRTYMWYVKLANPIALPNMPKVEGEESTGVVLSPTYEANGSGPRWPQHSQLALFHRDNTKEFANPYFFGDIKDREHVAGFLAHHFERMPNPERTIEERWALRRLELVSVLKHEVPVAYVSTHLPRMDDLRKADTRPLNAFEESALRKLAIGENLVAEATANTIRMMGAVRASKTCLKCHDAQRGDLLGSFSYELQRAK